MTEAVGAAVRTAETGPFSIEKLERLGGAWVGEEALAISLYCCLCFPDEFLSGVLAAVNHSGDSDSTGSITGNILGLIHGESAIPRDLVESLALARVVRDIAVDMSIGVKGSTDNRDEEWWEKYPGY